MNTPLGSHPYVDYSKCCSKMATVAVLKYLNSTSRKISGTLARVELAKIINPLKHETLIYNGYSPTTL